MTDVIDNGFLEEVIEEARILKGLIISNENARCVLSDQECPHYVSEWHKENFIAIWISMGGEYPIVGDINSVEGELDDSDKPGTVGQDITEGNKDDGGGDPVNEKKPKKKGVKKT